MSTYPPKKGKKKVNIPHNENVNILSNNNNQLSVSVKVSLNKVVNPIFSAVTVNATTNNDVSIPTKINVDIPKK